MDFLTQIQAMVDPILDDFGLECVDIEFKREAQGQVLRIFIDKEGGVTLDDCVTVSRELGAVLEVDDPVPGAYRLEVSSPGLDRPLKTPRDFERFAGQPVKIKTFSMLDPDQRGHSRKTFKGTLLGVTGEGVRVLQTDKKGGEALLPFTEISKAHLEPEF